MDYYVDNYKIASNVGSSYTWSNSSIKSLLGNIASVQRRSICFMKCVTKYNGEIVGSVLLAFWLYVGTCGTNEIAALRLKMTNSNSNYVFNNQPYFNSWGYYNHRIRLTGYGYNAINDSYTFKETQLRVRNGNSGGSYCTNTINSSSAYQSFTSEYTYSTLDTYETMWKNSSMCYPINFLRGSLNLVRSDNTNEYTSFTVACNDYHIPWLSYINIYRVDSNDVRDDDGKYVHIRFNGEIASTEHGEVCDSYGICLNGVPSPNFNYQSVTMKYKKTSDSSYTTTTLYSSSYDTVINYDRRHNAQLDPTAIYQFEFTITDKFGNTNTETLTLSVADVLIDYNANGHALGFGMPSQATGSQRIIDNCYPILFTSDVSGGNWQTNVEDYQWYPNYGMVTQRPGNTGKYYALFTHKRTTDVYGSDAMYSIVCKDTDTYSAAEMYIQCRWAYLKLTQNGLKINAETNESSSGNTGYYCDINPTSTYCNFNTNANYFYFNKSSIYANGNLLATQRWVNNQSYATQTWVNNKNYTTWNTVLSNLSGSNYNCGISGSTKDQITDWSNHTGNDKLCLSRDGTTSFQILFGRTQVNVPEGYGNRTTIKQWVSFSPSFGLTPVIIATPDFGHSKLDWQCTCTVSGKSTSGFYIELEVSGWTGGTTVCWFAIGRY